MNIDSEYAFLNRVLQIIADHMDELDRLVEITDRDMEDFHEYFWNSYTEFDEYGYELYDNTNAIRQGIMRKGDYIREKYTLGRMKDSPFFARVDFVFEGEQEASSLYIGISNLTENPGDIPLILDWRAPASSLFYDYDAGPASYEAPMGEVKGLISHKYQYEISSGRIIYMLESDMKVDDDILKAELGKNASASLKTIVTTIQREQNAIIRDTSHRILAVQGCAGSGKTSIALHRIAYLLYHNRNQLKASQILILSPNSLFADYISRILPELGEENISETSLDIWAYRKLARYGEAQDRYDRMEEILDPGAGPGLATDESAYKQGEEYVRELDGFMLELESIGIDIRDFRYHGRTYQTAYISGLFYDKLWNVPFMERMGRIAEFIIDDVETLRAQDMPAEEKQYIIDSLNSMYTERDLLKLYNVFLDTTDRVPLPVYETENGIRVDRIPYEDVYPLLYLQYSLYYNNQDRPVKHLVIDEMQDYSYLQFRLIEKAFDCPMTILGDRAQTIEEVQRDVLAFLPSIFGKDVHVTSLDRSYRSTMEITQYAAHIAGLDTVNSIDRHGAPVTEHEYADEVQRMSGLSDSLKRQDPEYETIAVLCSSAAGSRRVYEYLISAGLDREVFLLTPDTSSFKKGISVAPFYLSKGLEFDSVFIIDDEFEPEGLYRQALYVEATRALHELSVLKKSNKE